MKIYILIFSLAGILLAHQVNAQTPGQLSLSFSSAQAGGSYAPRHIVAAWIEDSNGVFVKTLLAYAASRKTHLNIWEASTTAAGSPFNVTDAITGPTQNAHTTYTCTWNGKNVAGVLVPDGTYKLRLELTDKNATGNYSTFTFQKTAAPLTLTPANVPSFSNIVLAWVPVSTEVYTHDSQLITISPNPAGDHLEISGVPVLGTKLYHLSGQLILESRHQRLDLSAVTPGLYLVHIETPYGLMVRKIIRR